MAGPLARTVRTLRPRSLGPSNGAISPLSRILGECAAPAPVGKGPTSAPPTSTHAWAFWCRGPVPCRSPAGPVPLLMQEPVEHQGREQTSGAPGSDPQDTPDDPAQATRVDPHAGDLPWRRAAGELSRDEPHPPGSRRSEKPIDADGQRRSPIGPEGDLRRDHGRQTEPRRHHSTAATRRSPAANAAVPPIRRLGPPPRARGRTRAPADPAPGPGGASAPGRLLGTQPSRTPPDTSGEAASMRNDRIAACSPRGSAVEELTPDPGSSEAFRGDTPCGTRLSIAQPRRARRPSLRRFEGTGPFPWSGCR